MCCSFIDQVVSGAAIHGATVFLVSVGVFMTLLVVMFLMITVGMMSYGITGKAPASMHNIIARAGEERLPTFFFGSFGFLLFATPFVTEFMSREVGCFCFIGIFVSMILFVATIPKN